MARLDSTGSSLLYSTYLGGSQLDYSLGVAVDATGDTYVAGFTASSSDFPLVAPIQATYGGGRGDGFVAKLDSTGTALVYSTYLGGSGGEGAGPLAVDGSGAVYVVGSTGSPDFPTKSPMQAALAGMGDAFVTKINAAGNALVYSTYLGGSGEDSGRGLAIDAAGSGYVVGATDSASDFPLVNPLQPVYGGGTREAFVSKIDPSGTTLVFSTFLGGGTIDQADGVAVDSAGNVYVVGFTFSLISFPVVRPVQPWGMGSFDAFVTKIDPTGTTLLYSTWLGGTEGEQGHAIAVDQAGYNVYVTGSTGSRDFPRVNAMDRRLTGYLDVFVARIRDLPPGVDEPISGRSLLVALKPGVPKRSRLTAVSRDPELSLGAENGSADDPVLHGGSVRIFTTAGDGFDATYSLPAANWRYIRREGENRGYRYGDRKRLAGPVTRVLLKPGKRLRIAAKGSGLSFTLGSDPNPVTIVLTTGQKRYCMSFGGTTVFKVDNRYRAKNAPAPAACPP